MVCELNSFLGVKYGKTENYFLQQVEAYKFAHSFPFGISKSNSSSKNVREIPQILGAMAVFPHSLSFLLALCT